MISSKIRKGTKSFRMDLYSLPDTGLSQVGLGLPLQVRQSVKGRPGWSLKPGWVTADAATMLALGLGGPTLRPQLGRFLV
jgi:hypothetical protein